MALPYTTLAHLNKIFECIVATPVEPLREPTWPKNPILALTDALGSKHQRVIVKRLELKGVAAGI